MTRARVRARSDSVAAAQRIFFPPKAIFVRLSTADPRFISLCNEPLSPASGCLSRAYWGLYIFMPAYSMRDPGTVRRTQNREQGNTNAKQGRFVACCLLHWSLIMVPCLVGRGVISSPCSRFTLSSGRVHAGARSAGKSPPFSRVNNTFSTGPPRAGHHREGGGASRGRGGPFKVSECRCADYCCWRCHLAVDVG